MAPAPSAFPCKTFCNTLWNLPRANLWPAPAPPSLLAPPPQLPLALLRLTLMWKWNRPSPSLGEIPRQKIFKERGGFKRDDLVKATNSDENKQGLKGYLNKNVQIYLKGDLIAKYMELPDQQRIIISCIGHFVMVTFIGIYCRF